MNKAFITGNCVIRGGRVYKDGALRHEVHATSPKAFLAEVYGAEGIAYPKFYKMDVLSQLGFLATEIALGGAGFAGGAGGSAYAPEDVGVVLSNANASLDTDIRYYKSVEDMPSPALFVYTLPNIMIGEICIRHGFKGENSFFVFKAFHATFIEAYVEGLLAGDLLKACVCGWVEVLGGTYDAAIFLVEQSGTQAFTTDNLNKIYERPWIS